MDCFIMPKIMTKKDLYICEHLLDILVDVNSDVSWALMGEKNGDYIFTCCFISCQKSFEATIAINKDSLNLIFLSNTISHILQSFGKNVIDNYNKHKDDFYKFVKIILDK